MTVRPGPDARGPTAGSLSRRGLLLGALGGIASLALPGCRSVLGPRVQAISIAANIRDGAAVAANALAAAAASGPAAAAVAAPDASSAIAVEPRGDRVDEHTVFEVASITKTITAIALASVVLEGKASLDDPVDRWVDAGVNGSITLRQLATHTSGLPRLPPALTTGPRNHEDPYNDYSGADALRDLRRVQLGPPVESYSNYGFMILGFILERIDDRGYGAVTVERVFRPLGMADATAEGIPTNRATGRRRGRQVPHWNHKLAGAGGVEASITDIAAYLQAQIAPPPDVVGEAIKLAQGERLGWASDPTGVTWHNGGSGGFSAMLAFNERAGAVLLIADGELEDYERPIIDLVARA